MGTPSNVDSAKSAAGADWTAARKLVALLGHLPANFTSCVRTVKLAEMRMADKDASALRTLALRNVSPIVHLSPTLKSVYYFAAHELHERALDDVETLDERALLGLFNADELLAALSITLVARRVRRLCDDEQWKRLYGYMRVHMELGHAVGSTVEHVGGANAMLVAALRYLGVAMLMIKDLEKYKAYRREAIKKDVLFDTKLEESSFGCSHFQIAALLLQHLGYGSQIGDAMYASQNARCHDFASWLPKQDEFTQCWSASLLWTESLHNMGKISDELRGNEDLFLPDESIMDLQSLARVLRDKGSSWDWPLKSKQDLPESVQSKLGIGTAAAGSESIDDTMMSGELGKGAPLDE